MSNYRQICFERYDKKCSNCSTPDQIHVHHIDGRANNNTAENLIPLCEDCHNVVERNCWTEEPDRDIKGEVTPLLKWLVQSKRVKSPNCNGSSRPSAIRGLSEEDMNKIRMLQGHIQTEIPERSVSHRDTIMWAVENELEKYDE